MELDYRQRAEACYELVLNGATWSVVKKSLKYASIAEARRDFATLLAEATSEKDREAEINKMSLQLDRLYRKSLTIINSSTVRDGDKIKAITAAARLLSQKAELEGYKQPIRHQHHLTRSAEEDLNNTIKMLVGHRMSNFPQEADILEAEVVE